MQKHERNKKTSYGRMLLIMLITAAVLMAGNWCYQNWITPALYPLAEEIKFDEKDHALQNTDTLVENDAHYQVIEWFYRYFTDEDCGGVYFGIDDDLHFNLVKNSPHRENIARFLELANAELERNGFATIKTHEVDFAAQELIDLSLRLGETLHQNNIPWKTLGIDTQNNRIRIVNDDISFFYQLRVFMHIDPKYVYFEEQQGSFVFQ